MRIKGLLVGAVTSLVAACGSQSAGGRQAGPQQPCGQQKFPATFQAESAQLQGVEVSAQDEGFTGSGYVAGFAEVGDQVTFQVCAPESGYYTLEFTYAKGTDGVATRKLLLDGNVFPGQPRFPPRWTWSTWASGGERAVHLDAGNHSIALAFQDGDSGEIHLDNLQVSKGPSPTETSVTSLLMNNWTDLVIGWHASKLYPKDDKSFGPRMLSLHWAKDWPTDQLDEAQAFFRDETSNTSYTDTHQFDTRARFTASDTDGFGELRVEYGDYGGKATPMTITRSMIVPPGEPFVVVRYGIVNVTDSARQISILEWADLHNKTAGQSEDPAFIHDVSGDPQSATGALKAEWHPELAAWIADLSETNGTFLVVGSFDAIDHHVAGAPVTGGPDSGPNGAEVVKKFAGGASSLSDSDTFSGTDAAIGMSRTINLGASARAGLAFFYAVADSLDGAKALAERIRKPGTATYWTDQSSRRWKDWLESGKAAAALAPPVPQWAQALRVAMVTNRQSQQPEFGSFVAATNPAYNYSVWARDSSVVAMAFDAAGYLDEADKFWSWMAQVPSDGSNSKVPAGSWWTNYSFFARNRPISFVEPEFDAIGLYLVGTYRHYLALQAKDPGRAAQFRDAAWDTVQKAADLVKTEAAKSENHGFGAPDFSIWEEQLQYVTFTQATYVAGLRAARLLAQARNDASKAQDWGDASDRIRETIFRDTSASPCPGEWFGSKNYFVRAVQPDCTLDARVDASSDLLWVLGILDAKDARAAQHRDAVLANLTPGKFGFGVARYEGDTFYNSNPASPGGMFEAKGEKPVWPQMSMYMAMLEHWVGADELASDRLSWYVATTLWGDQPQGEAVDWTTESPLVSTASEPVTGAWFVLALLNQLGMFDPRLP